MNNPPTLDQTKTDIKEIRNIMLEFILPGLFLAFICSLIVEIVRRMGWDSSWSNPARLVMNEHFAPNSLILFVALADLLWGPWFMVTSFRDALNKEESWIYRKLISFLKFTNQYVSLFIGMYIGIFIKVLLFTKTIDFGSLKAIIILICVGFLLLFYPWFNDQKRAGNKFSIFIFGLGIMLHALYFYIMVAQLPLDWSNISNK